MRNRRHEPLHAKTGYSGVVSTFYSLDWVKDFSLTLAGETVERIYSDQNGRLGPHFTIFGYRYRIGS